MVFVSREQQPQQQKKSKLSIFRLGKSSKGQDATAPAVSSAPSRGPSSLTSMRSVSQPAPDSPPSTLPRGARRTLQEARRVQSESNDRAAGFTFPSERDDVKLGSEFSDDSGPDVYQHERSSSLPLDRLTSSKSARAISPHVLHRIETSNGVLGGRHTRQRSHFSIPDVVITACEEDGEQVHIELEVPADKCRSYVFAKAKHASQQADRAAKKAAKTSRKKLTPLIDLGHEVATAELASSASVASSLDGVANEHDGAAPSRAAPDGVTSTTVSSGTIGSPTSKRPKKSSFPSLFGRKSLDSSRAPAPAAALWDPMPLTPRSPNAPEEHPIVYSTGYESTGSLPSSSRESLPGGPSDRGKLFNPNAGPPSPPETPTLATRPLTKKELKAREKEEMALIKELEKIDKMVREHDNKARKAAEKALAKERKRAVAADKQQQPQQPPSASTTKRTSRAFKRITIFSAASKASPSGNVGRRGSVMRKRDTLALDDNKQAVGQLRSGSSGGRPNANSPPQDSRYDFPMSPSTPPRGKQPPSKRNSLESPGSASVQSPRTAASGAPDKGRRPEGGSSSDAWSPPQLEGQKDSEELDQSTWRSLDWAELDPRRSSQFDSLIKRSEQQQQQKQQQQQQYQSGDNALRSGAPPPPPSSYRFSPTTAAVIEEERSRFSPPESKRNSVQRAFALADAEEAILRKKSSLRRRGGGSSQQQSMSQQQQQPKRTSRLNSSGGLSSKRSSVASDPRRRSLIRQLDAFEGWEVADQPELEGEGDPDMANWVDSLDLQRQGGRGDDGNGGDDVDFPLPSSASAMMQEMLHVDRVLKDLQDAQAASSAGSSSDGGSDARVSKTPRSNARELDGLDDGQSTPRASAVGGIKRPNIPTISSTPASVDSGLDQIAALGSPIRTKVGSSAVSSSSSPPSRGSGRFSRPIKSERRSESNPSSPTTPRSPMRADRINGHSSHVDASLRSTKMSSKAHASPSSEGQYVATTGSNSRYRSPPTSSSSSSSTSSSTASSPVSSGARAKAAEFRISMAPFQPIDLFGVDVTSGIVGTGSDE